MARTKLVEVDSMQQQMMEPMAVDCKEAARLTSLSKFTILDLVRKNKLKAIRVGRRVLIPLESLKGMLK